MNLTKSLHVIKALFYLENTAFFNVSEIRLLRWMTFV